MRSTVGGQGQLQRSSSRDLSSPYNKNYISLRNKSRDNSSNKKNSYKVTYSSNKGSISHRGATTSRERSSNSKGNNDSMLNVNNQGKISNEKVYSVFTTKEKSNVVICNERGLEGKFINDSIIDRQDLKYLNSQICGQTPYFTFNFDNVFNESHKQEKFYSQTVRPLVRNFIEGENGCVILFGPTQGGKTYTLKGKTGIERGILPRAVEDVFNIVRDNQDFSDDSKNYDLHIMNSQRDYCYDQENTFRQQNIQSQYSSRTQNSKERVFLKVSVYQIFVDKILDLLSTKSFKNTSKQVYIDHLIDKQTEEVVSKVRNVTEKVILNIEDFYGALQDAFKNRRIESVSTQQSDLRKKSHLIITLTLMKRTSTQQLQELSTLNFVELSGSEQAVSQEKFFQDSSIKQFVTKSFNGLSSQILKSALKKKQPYSSLNDNDAPLVDCLRKTLTSQSNIVLICNVNPTPSHYEHSLPAVKFCARIRDTIVKKLAIKESRQQNPSSQLSTARQSSTKLGVHRQSQQQSIQSIGTLENNIFRQVNEAIQMIKDEIADRQIQQNRVVNLHDNDKWALEKLENIHVIMDVLKTEDHQFEEKQKVLILSELNYLRDSVSKFRHVLQSNMQTPRQFQAKDSYLEQTNSPRIQPYNKIPRSSSNVMFQSQNSYNPYQQSTYNQQALNNQHDQEPAFNPLISVQDSNEKRTFNSNNNAFDSYDRLAVNNRNHPIYTDCDNYSQFNYGSQQQSNRKFDIKEFQEDYQSKHSAISTNNKYSNPTDLAQQESEVLNRLHPLVNRSLSPKKNSISEQPSPQQDVSKIIIPQTQNGYRYTQNSQLKSSGFQQRPTQSQQTYEQLQSMNIPTQQSQNSYQTQLKSTTFQQTNPVFSPNKNPFDTLSQTKVKLSQNLQPLSKPLPDYNLQLQTIKQLQVYSSDQDAIQDLTRLFKLNDFEGLKLRVQQILREKDSLEKLTTDCIDSQQYQKEQLEIRDQIISEQDQIIELGKLEFSQTIDNIEKQHKEKEQSALLQSTSITDHLKDMQSLIKVITDEKETLIKAQSILELENKQLLQQKQESDSKLETVQQENSKMKSNYEILKEHEMNIIRETEDKKNKEIKEYEQKMQIYEQESSQALSKCQEMEQKMFKMKEQIKNQDIDQQKLSQDLQYTQQQLQIYTTKLETHEDTNLELKKQCDQYLQEYHKLEEQRDKYENQNKQMSQEILQLHVLIEKMEQKITEEQQKRQEEIVMREARERETHQLKEEKKQLEIFINQKDLEIEQGVQRELNLHQLVQQKTVKYEELDKQLTLFKAKEYDKVDVLKKSAELEARFKLLAFENENYKNMQNQNEQQLNLLQKERQELQQQLLVAQSELDFIRQANEEHLDKMDSKFSDIHSEITKLRNENIQLKEKEKLHKRQLKEQEQDMEDLQIKLTKEQKRNEEFNGTVTEMEREIRMLIEEKEKEQKMLLMKQLDEQRAKDENKGVILGDIHNMIKNYKDEKKYGKVGGQNYNNKSGYNLQNQSDIVYQ